MMTFRFAFFNEARQVVEVWNQERFVAAIYPAEQGVRIISKYALVGVLDVQDPNALNVTIGVKP